jgi:hypothetical protein
LVVFYARSAGTAYAVGEKKVKSYLPGESVRNVSAGRCAELNRFAHGWLWAQP